MTYNIDRYDEEILFTDRHLGRLVDFLDETGRGESTLVVVIADHGEQFQEHGWLGHTNRLYENLIRVPLLMRYPGGIPAGQVIKPRALDQALTVRKGDEVYINAMAGGLSVRMLAIALGNGKTGDSINAIALVRVVARLG